ncbi:hypothetical protein [Flavobacterium sp.]|uniref:hypothetical protein n=1 Tax=Flavobacterium sp. TaxID=239 RepID=UPI0037BE2C78
MTGAYESIAVCLARRIAMKYGENQQAAIIQTAARMLDDADETTKLALLDLIAATPSERQRIVAYAEVMILTC